MDVSYLTDLVLRSREKGSKIYRDTNGIIYHQTRESSSPVTVRRIIDPRELVMVLATSIVSEDVLPTTITSNKHYLDFIKSYSQIASQKQLHSMMDQLPCENIHGNINGPIVVNKRFVTESQVCSIDNKRYLVGWSNNIVVQRAVTGGYSGRVIFSGKTAGDRIGILDALKDISTSAQYETKRRSRIHHLAIPSDDRSVQLMEILSVMGDLYHMKISPTNALMARSLMMWSSEFIPSSIPSMIWVDVDDLLIFKDFWETTYEIIKRVSPLTTIFIRTKTLTRDTSDMFKDMLGVQSTIEFERGKPAVIPEDVVSEGKEAEYDKALSSMPDVVTATIGVTISHVINSVKDDIFKDTYKE